MANAIAIYGSKLYTPLTNNHLLPAQQVPYNNFN